MSAINLLGVPSTANIEIDPSHKASDLMEDACFLHSLGTDIIFLVASELMDEDSGIAADPKRAGSAICGALKLLEAASGLNEQALTRLIRLEGKGRKA